MKPTEPTFENKFQIIKSNFKKLQKTGEQNKHYAGIINKFESFEALENSQKNKNLQPYQELDCKYWVNILHGICETKKFKPDSVITDAKQRELYYNAPE